MGKENLNVITRQGQTGMETYLIAARHVDVKAEPKSVAHGDQDEQHGQDHSEERPLVKRRVEDNTAAAHCLGLVAQALQSEDEQAICVLHIVFSIKPALCFKFYLARLPVKD